MTRTVTRYGANLAGTAFVEGAAPAGTNPAEFKNVVVSANWTDANGQPRTIAMRTTLSALALDTNSPLVDDASANHKPQGAVVRQANPETAGMIPIALGNGESTAASTPTPEQVGATTGGAIIGTKFNVLTYKPETGGSNLAVIQDRVETEVLKCTCQYGQGGTNFGAIYQKAQWPAVWTGTRYDVYTPDTNTAAPGEVKNSGPKPGVEQSALCQECCRDHHDDPLDSTNAKFDPESGATTYTKYNLSAGTLVAQTNMVTGTYIDSCRIIRVDGMWRTAADMYERQHGLLETESDTYGVQAKTGVPTTTAKTAYTTYVKDYLKQYDGTVATAPTNAATMYNETARGLNAPATVAIAMTNPAPDPPDYRYLHARGLYVDYLEKSARDTLTQTLAKRRAKGECDLNSTTLADCVLPYLPFTTVNLTEISAWSRDNSSVVFTHTSTLLDLNPTLPSGGRTDGKGAGTANVTSTMRVSNSGVAASDTLTGGVEPNDETTTLSDAQNFTVTAPTTPTTDVFYAVVNGGGTLTSLKPSTPSTAASYGECLAPSGPRATRDCKTNVLLPSSAKLTVSKYNAESTTSVRVNDVLPSGMQCSYNGTMVNVENGNGEKIDQPRYENFRISSVSTTSGSASFTAPTNDGTTTEVATVTVTSMVSGGTVTINFTSEGYVNPGATMTSCTASKDNSGKYHMATAVWNKPWGP